MLHEWGGTGGIWRTVLMGDNEVYWGGFCIIILQTFVLAVLTWFSFLGK